MLLGSQSVDLNQKSRGGCMTQNWPLVNLFPKARDASPENAPLDSPAPANGIVGASAPLRLADRAYSRVDGKMNDFLIRPHARREYENHPA
jgi:hypothetical protein